MMEGDSVHQSLALLAGVAIDQGLESINGVGVVPMSMPIQVPIQIVSHHEGIEEDGVHDHHEIVEVQYIIDHTGQYHVATAEDLGGDAEQVQCDQSEDEEDLLRTSSDIRILPDDDAEIKDEYIEGILCKKCFLCANLYEASSLRDLFDEENQQTYLPELLNRYLQTTAVPKFNSKEEHPICQCCVDTVQQWHIYFTKVKDIQNANVSSSTAEASEDENSEADQPRGKGRGKYQKRIGTRKYRHTLLQNQIKNTLFASSFHHLVKRNMSDEDWEYIAERLHSTKSNSSIKVKEIEKLVFQKEKLITIFCEECRKSIPDGKEGFQAHRRDVHQSDEVTLPCDLCGNYYPEKDTTGLSQSFFPHWLFHFYFYGCTECNERFPNTALSKKHEDMHKERPGFPCPMCDKVLSKKITLDQHIKTHLPDEEKKKLAKPCHICGKIITAPTLKAHIFSVHTNERPWKCEICGSRFKHKSDLTGHRNAVHLKIKNFHCPVCGRSFGHHCGLRVHMAKHENRREHECNICGKKFITHWHLKKHQIAHKTEKDIICQVCGKGFKKEDALQEHMTLHTGEKPHECHICGRKVRVLSNLYKHFLVHKKNKTYYSKKDGEPPGHKLQIIQSDSELGETEIEISSNDIENDQTLQILQHSEVLQVNRSSNVISYPAASSSAAAPPNSIATSTSSDGLTMIRRYETSVPGLKSEVVSHADNTVEVAIVNSNSDGTLTSPEMFTYIHPSQIVYQVSTDMNINQVETNSTRCSSEARLTSVTATTSS